MWIIQTCNFIVTTFKNFNWNPNVLILVSSMYDLYLENYSLLSGMVLFHKHIYLFKVYTHVWIQLGIQYDLDITIWMWQKLDIQWKLTCRSFSTHLRKIVDMPNQVKTLWYFEGSYWWESICRIFLALLFCKAL